MKLHSYTLALGRTTSEHRSPVSLYSVAGGSALVLICWLVVLGQHDGQFVHDSNPLKNAVVVKADDLLRKCKITIIIKADKRRL